MLTQASIDTFVITKHGGAQANGTRISPLNIISIPILITEVSKTRATIAFTVRLFLKAKLGWPKT